MELLQIYCRFVFKSCEYKLQYFPSLFPRAVSGVQWQSLRWNMRMGCAGWSFMKGRKRPPECQTYYQGKSIRSECGLLVGILHFHSQISSQSSPNLAVSATNTCVPVD